MRVAAVFRHYVSSLEEFGTAVRVFGRAGMLRPSRPARLARMGWELQRWGFTLAGGFAANAARDPEGVAVVDERGTLTFDALHRRSNAVANGLVDTGIEPGAAVAVLCRNHRGFVDATAALAKLGATALQCNTDFAAAQLREVIAREQPVAIISDEEFARVVHDAAPQMPNIFAEDDGSPTRHTIGAFAAPASDSELPPTRSGRTIILTSGTTGTPRGVARGQSSGAGPFRGALHAATAASR
ncbi:MAG: AMP-binding protein [Acidimicrobiia bacterium]